MLQRLTVITTCLCIVLLSSCAAKKELASAKDEISQLQSKVNSLTADNKALEAQVENFTATRQVAMQDFAHYKEECEAAKQKLQVVKENLTEQYNSLQEVQKKIDAALADFANKGVHVYYDNGLVYVSMEDNLLYKSGSAALGANAKTALGSLASVLNDYPKLKVIVVGHTDDKQFNKGSDNWSLSTERANGVVRALRDDYKVDPTRLTSAGKGKYEPVDDNSTEAGRAKNRRTDIILNPDLVKIWQSVQDK